MTYPVLQQYLARLSGAASPTSSIGLDAEGRAQGRFFNCNMTSSFQPIRQLASGAIHGYEGLARSVAPADQGLSLWRLLDHAASDDESVELDRLCRMLHAINFFRQEPDGSSALYLNVHDRLLSAVSSNHGHAFHRILDALGLPVARIVLQLPAVTEQQGWLLQYVSDNYRRNGFSYAVTAASAADGLALLERVRPAVIKLDARVLGAGAGHDLEALLRASQAAGVDVIVKRVDTPQALATLRQLAAGSEPALLAQGFLLDAPAPLLRAAAPLQVAY